MKIIVLTTETPHHLFFLNEISKHFKIDGIVLEQLINTPSFEISHPFEQERDNFEVKELLNNTLTYEDISITKKYDSVNDEKCINFISDIQPEVIIVFGTGIIRKQLINLCFNGIINLHGGDPQKYRGLDTHLWAIYHKEFNELVTTLHRLSNLLDDGDIIKQAPININQKSNIHMLRAENTKICIKIVLSALKDFKKYNKFISSPQDQRGRYYSFMPRVLKDVCIKNLQRYVKTL